jgi:hypothetical protein
MMKIVYFSGVATNVRATRQVQEQLKTADEVKQLVGDNPHLGVPPASLSWEFLENLSEKLRTLNIPRPGRLGTAPGSVLAQFPKFNISLPEGILSWAGNGWFGNTFKLTTQQGQSFLLKLAHHRDQLNSWMRNVLRHGQYTEPTTGLFLTAQKQLPSSETYCTDVKAGWWLSEYVPPDKRVPEPDLRMMQVGSYLAGIGAQPIAVGPQSFIGQKLVDKGGIAINAAVYQYWNNALTLHHILTNNKNPIPAMTQLVQQFGTNIDFRYVPENYRLDMFQAMLKSPDRTVQQEALSDYNLHLLSEPQQQQAFVHVLKNHPQWLPHFALQLQYLSENNVASVGQQILGLPDLQQAKISVIQAIDKAPFYKRLGMIQQVADSKNAVLIAEAIKQLASLPEEQKANAHSLLTTAVSDPQVAQMDQIYNAHNPQALAAYLTSERI